MTDKQQLLVLKVGDIENLVKTLTDSIEHKNQQADEDSDTAILRVISNELCILKMRLEDDGDVDSLAA